MSLAIQNPSLPVHITETGKPTASSFFEKIKNFPLLGRLFTINYQDLLMIGAVVFYIAKMAIDFFSGAWMLALVEGATALLVAKLRKQLIESMDMEGALKTTKKENLTFHHNNLQLTRTQKALQKEVNDLTSLKGEFEKERYHFHDENLKLTKSREGIENTITEALKNIKQTGSLGAAGVKTTLEQALKTLKTQQKIVEKLEKDQTLREGKMNKTWEDILTRTSQISALEADMYNKQQAQIDEQKKTISANQEAIKHLKEERARLQKIVTDLEVSANRVDTVSQGLKKNWDGHDFIPRDPNRAVLWFTGLAVLSYGLNYLNNHREIFTSAAA